MTEEDDSLKREASEAGKIDVPTPSYDSIPALAQNLTPLILTQASLSPFLSFPILL